jgi:V/A-type H+-transporting ATPase subunit A
MRDLSAASFTFRPGVQAGEELAAGGILAELEKPGGTVQHCLVPPDVPGGEVMEIAGPGDYREDEVICRLRDPSGRVHALSMGHRWPVRIPRPASRRLPADEPMSSETAGGFAA